MSDKIDEQVEIVNYDSQAQDGEKKKYHSDGEH